MKIILILAAVLIGIWLFRSNRRADKQTRAPGPQKNAATDPQEMARCLLCEVHLPKMDSIQGRRGIYCSLEHRQRAEP